MLFPDNKKFAFTIFDDTDMATVANIRPIYEFLTELKIFTTKSVWVFPSDDLNNPNYQTETLENPNYLSFIRWLSNNGFEIALHNVSAGLNEREKIISGFDYFYKTLGFYPTSHSNHYYNNYDSLYFGRERLNSILIRLAMKITKHNVRSKGHLKNSPYFWGDICQKYIRYVRNFTFKEINLLNINPTLPYHDPQKPLVAFWFSASEASNVKEFNKLLSSSNQAKLEKEKGVSIIYTHFAFGFVEDGKVNEETKKLLTQLSKRPGWFVPVSPLLDYLRSQRENSRISRVELRKMEWRWFLEKAKEIISKKIWNLIP